MALKLTQRSCQILLPQTRGNQRDEARAKNAKAAAGKGLSSKDQKSLDGLSVQQVRS